MVEAWTTSNYRHTGEFWDIEIPQLRPKVYQKPHPPTVRAVATEGSLMEMARNDRPFMMVIHPEDVTRQRFDLYRQTMDTAGYDEESIARNIDDSWVWRNIVVAETDAEAREIGVPAYLGRREHVIETRSSLNTSS